MNQSIEESAGAIVITAESPEDAKELEELLAAAGFQTYTAASGADCIALARKASPGLIVAGIERGQDDGLAAWEALKASSETRHVPILAVTATTDMDFVGQLFAAGAQDCVFKPVRSAELVCRVHRVLTQRARGFHPTADDALPSIVTSARKLCHELNQPLQYVLGSVQLLMMDIAPGDPLHGSLGNIRLQVERMGQLNAKLMETIRSMAVS